MRRSLSDGWFLTCSQRGLLSAWACVQRRRCMCSLLTLPRCRKASCLFAPGYLLVLVYAAFWNWKTLLCKGWREKNTSLEWKHCCFQPLDGLHFMFVTCNSYLKGTCVTADVMCHVIKALVTFSDLLKTNERSLQHVNAICHGKAASQFSNHICLLWNAASPWKKTSILMEEACRFTDSQILYIIHLLIFFLLIMNPEGWKLQQIHDSFRSSVSLELYLLSDFLVLWIGTILPMILIFCRYSWGSQMEVWKVWAVSGTCNRTWGVCKNRGLFFINLCLFPWSIKGTEMC